MNKFFILAVLLLSAGVQAGAGPKFLGSMPASKPAWPGLPYERRNIFYVQGVSPLLASKEEARIQALKDAAQKAAEFLDGRGFGNRREIAQHVETAVLDETLLRSVKLGKVKVEGTYQEHWVSADGVDEYRVNLFLSIRRR